MKFTKTLTIISFLFLGCILYAQQNNLPNIVYIMADDMGIGDISALNKNSKINTPNLDALIDSGITFTDAHTAAAVCTPTRYGLMTGRYPWRSELKRGVTLGYSQSIINTKIETVPELLKQNGYNTAMVGKWHLGFNWTFKGGKEDAPKTLLEGKSDNYAHLVDYTKPFTKGPIDHGFDYFYGMAASPDMGPYVFLENNMVTEVPLIKTGFKGANPNFPGGKHKDLKGKQQMIRAGLNAEGFQHNKVMLTYTQKSQEYIHNYDSKKPFFLYIPYASPHTPVLPRDEFIGTSKAGIYGDFVQELDWSIGQIMKTLKEKGIEKNTLVIFTADNGYAPASFPKEYSKKFDHQSSGGYRGHKANLYEGGHRVPFIARWPKEIKKKTTCATAISLNDLYATCKELTNDKRDLKNEGVDSYSILDLLKGKDKYSRPSFMFSDYKGAMAVRKGDYKLILGKKKELFNLKEDVSETKDLYLDEAYKEVVEDLYATAVKLVENGRTTEGAVLKNDGEPYWKELNVWLKK